MRPGRATHAFRATFRRAALIAASVVTGGGMMSNRSAPSRRAKCAPASAACGKSECDRRHETSSSSTRRELQARRRTQTETSNTVNLHAHVVNRRAPRRHCCHAWGRDAHARGAGLAECSARHIPCVVSSSTGRGSTCTRRYTDAGRANLDGQSSAHRRFSGFRQGVNSLRDHDALRCHSSELTGTEPACAMVLQGECP